MTLGLCAMSPEIGMPVGKMRLAMDALMVQRLGGTKPSPLATSIKIGLHGFEQVVQDEGGWVIVRPLAMDILMIIAINWRRFWREWIRVGDMGGDPIGMMREAMSTVLFKERARMAMLDGPSNHIILDESSRL